MADRNQVAELVEIPLQVSFATFLESYESTFLPVLIAQAGLISVRTGQKLGQDRDDVWAVSLTQWKSLEAHERFVSSTDAGPFFAGVGALSKGPPTVRHFEFGSTDQYKNLGFSEFRTYNLLDRKDVDRILERNGQYESDQIANQPIISARCLEDASIAASVRFSAEVPTAKDGHGDGALDGTPLTGQFVVKWTSFAVAAARASL